MLIGYARVSTHDQNLDLQREALTKAGCECIFDDKLSGRRAERPGLRKALDLLRDGDMLSVTTLSDDLLFRLYDGSRHRCSVAAH